MLRESMRSEKDSWKNDNLCKGEYNAALAQFPAWNRSLAFSSEAFYCLRVVSFPKWRSSFEKPQEILERRPSLELSMTCCAAHVVNLAYMWRWGRSDQSGCIHPRGYTLSDLIWYCDWLPPFRSDPCRPHWRLEGFTCCKICRRTRLDALSPLHGILIDSPDIAVDFPSSCRIIREPLGGGGAKPFRDAEERASTPL